MSELLVAKKGLDGLFIETPFLTFQKIAKKNSYINKKAVKIGQVLYKRQSEKVVLRN